MSLPVGGSNTFEKETKTAESTGLKDPTSRKLGTLSTYGVELHLLAQAHHLPIRPRVSRLTLNQKIVVRIHDGQLKLGKSGKG